MGTAHLDSLCTRVQLSVAEICPPVPLVLCAEDMHTLPFRRCRDLPEQTLNCKSCLIGVSGVCFWQPEPTAYLAETPPCNRPFLFYFLFLTPDRLRAMFLWDVGGYLLAMLSLRNISQRLKRIPPNNSFVPSSFLILPSHRHPSSCAGTVTKDVLTI